MESAAQAAGAGVIVVGAEQASQAAGQQPVVEDPMAYVPVVLGKRGWMAPPVLDYTQTQQYKR